MHDRVLARTELKEGGFMAKHARPPSDHVVFYSHAHAQTIPNTYSISVFVHACRRSRVDSVHKR